MKISYLIYFLAISSLHLEISADSITGFFRNILDLFSDKRRFVHSKDVIKDNETIINDENSCRLSSGNTLTDRIVGGEIATPFEFPWLVSIQIEIKNKTYHNCGGSLIHELFVLTAGHCVHGTNPNRMRIAAGKYQLNIHEEYEQIRSVTKTYANIYKSVNFKNDIALMKLNAPIIFDSIHIAPGCLATKGEHFKENAVVAGWGRMKENGEIPYVLRKVIIPLLDSETCNNNYKLKGFGAFLHECQICTLADGQNEQDACQGDSGGPLMCITETDNTWRICGIVSWGVGCARIGNPGVYTEVACHVEWIKDTINANLD